MGIFGTLLTGVSKAIKYGTYVGSLYTFFGYFYVQQVKYRLGDSKECQNQDYQWLKSSFNNNQNGEQNGGALFLASLFCDVYTFYARTWFFRQFQQDCNKFHKAVVASILNNYEQYGLFEKAEVMRQQIINNNINPATITKILHVKELNNQLTSLYANQFVKIISRQIYLRTGSILGMSKEQKEKIDLIYNYMEKGQRLIFPDDQKYWQYKLSKEQTKRHRYSDTIFKLIYI